MRKTAIFYGSTTGNCESIARRIAERLDIDQSAIFTASDLDSEKITLFDNFLLGSSTWGCGDLQDEWYDGVEVIKSTNLLGKTVAIFGCGDSCGFSSTFCNAMATIAEAAEAAGANIIGAVSTDGYTFDESEAAIDGHFVGLALDEDNESDLTDNRIAAWADEIKPLL